MRWLLMAAVAAALSVSLAPAPESTTPQPTARPQATAHRQLMPRPQADCVLAVDAHGEGDWYCGRVIRVPQGSRVEAPGMAACEMEDGSHTALPCRWDAALRGNHEGSSYTVLQDPFELLIRYDDGVTVVLDN